MTADSNVTLDGMVSMVSMVQQSSDDYNLARFLDIDPNKISHTSDEEEDDAPSSPPQIDIDSIPLIPLIPLIHAPYHTICSEGEVEAQPTGEGAVPKTEPCIAGKRSGNNEDARRIADEK